MFAEPVILPREMLEAKKAKRASKKKTGGTAKRTSKRSPGKSSRSR